MDLQNPVEEDAPHLPIDLPLVLHGVFQGKVFLISLSDKLYNIKHKRLIVKGANLGPDLGRIYL